MTESLVTVEVGGQAFPYKTEPRCHVCSSEHRLEIEKALARGHLYKRIEERFADSDNISSRSLQAHVANGHIPLDAAAVYAAARARSAEVTEALDPYIQDTAVELTFAHAVLDRVRARVQAAQIEPTVRDGLAAAKLIAQSEKTAGVPITEMDFWTYKYELYAMVKTIMSDEQLQQFVRLGNEMNRERAEYLRRAETGPPMNGFARPRR